MELPVAEDLLRNTENFNIAFGNVVHMNYANNSEESSEYNMTIQRDNISTLVLHICMFTTSLIFAISYEPDINTFQYIFVLFLFPSF